VPIYFTFLWGSQSWLQPLFKRLKLVERSDISIRWAPARIAALCCRIHISGAVLPVLPTLTRIN
jgi:hypothetical protein